MYTPVSETFVPFSEAEEKQISAEYAKRTSQFASFPKRETGLKITIKVFLISLPIRSFKKRQTHSATSSATDSEVNLAVEEASIDDVD